MIRQTNPLLNPTNHPSHYSRFISANFNSIKLTPSTITPQQVNNYISIVPEGDVERNRVFVTISINLATYFALLFLIFLYGKHSLLKCYIGSIHRYLCAVPTKIHFNSTICVLSCKFYFRLFVIRRHIE